MWTLHALIIPDHIGELRKSNQELISVQEQLQCEIAEYKDRETERQIKLDTKDRSSNRLLGDVTEGETNQTHLRAGIVKLEDAIVCYGTKIRQTQEANVDLHLQYQEREEPKITEAAVHNLQLELKSVEADTDCETVELNIKAAEIVRLQQEAGAQRNHITTVEQDVATHQQATNDTKIALMTHDNLKDKIRTVDRENTDLENTAREYSPNFQRLQHENEGQIIEIRELKHKLLKSDEIQESLQLGSKIVRTNRLPGSRWYDGRNKTMARKDIPVLEAPNASCGGRMTGHTAKDQQVKELGQEHRDKEV